MLRLLLLFYRVSGGFPPLLKDYDSFESHLPSQGARILFDKETSVQQKLRQFVAYKVYGYSQSIVLMANISAQYFRQF